MDRASLINLNTQHHVPPIVVVAHAPIAVPGGSKLGSPTVLLLGVRRFYCPSPIVSVNHQSMVTIVFTQLLDGITGQSFGVVRS